MFRMAPALLSFKVAQRFCAQCAFRQKTSCRKWLEGLWLRMNPRFLAKRRLDISSSRSRRRHLDSPTVVSVVLLVVFLLQLLWLGWEVGQNCGQTAVPPQPPNNNNNDYSLSLSRTTATTTTTRGTTRPTRHETNKNSNNKSRNGRVPLANRYKILEAYQYLYSRNNSHNNSNKTQDATKGLRLDYSKDYAVVYPNNNNNNNLYHETGPSRVFPKWTRPFPCAEWEGSYRRTATTEGFLYLKEIKTGSSTLAGVTMRIARNMARRLHRESEMCRSRFFHGRARRYEHRLPNQSFLWTVLREPTARLLSKFFHFAVSRQDVTPNAAQMEAFFRGYRVWIVDHAYYLKTMTLRDINPREIALYPNFTHTLLHDYDFIGITERMDESLVVLQLLLGLETGDILYMSSKSQGSFEYMPKHQSCIHLMRKFMTPDMERLVLRSEFWQNYTEADRMIYRAANRSLDLTMDVLGRNVVARELAKLRFAQKLAYQQCREATVFPCDEDGIDHHNTTTCLFQDSACGYQCLDQLATQLPTMPAFLALDHNDNNNNNNNDNNNNNNDNNK